MNEIMLKQRAFLVFMGDDTYFLNSCLLDVDCFQLIFKPYTHIEAYVHIRKSKQFLRAHVYFNQSRCAWFKKSDCACN